MNRSRESLLNTPEPSHEAEDDSCAIVDFEGEGEFVPRDYVYLTSKEKFELLLSDANSWMSELQGAVCAAILERYRASDRDLAEQLKRMFCSSDDDHRIRAVRKVATRAAQQLDRFFEEAPTTHSLGYSILLARERDSRGPWCYYYHSELLSQKTGKTELPLLPSIAPTIFAIEEERRREDERVRRGINPLSLENLLAYTHSVEFCPSLKPYDDSTRAALANEQLQSLYADVGRSSPTPRPPRPWALDNDCVFIRSVGASPLQEIVFSLNDKYVGYTWGHEADPALLQAAHRLVANTVNALSHPAPLTVRSHYSYRFERAGGDAARLVGYLDGLENLPSRTDHGTYAFALASGEQAQLGIRHLTRSNSRLRGRKTVYVSVELAIEDPRAYPQLTSKALERHITHADWIVDNYFMQQFIAPVGHALSRD